MDAIAELDQQLFHYINQVLAYPPLDPVMTTITRIRYWRVPFGILGVLLFFFGGKKGKIVVLLLIPAIAVSDVFNAKILKHVFERVRPCHELPDVRLLVSCRHSPSFPSNHAFNIFTAATLFAQFYSWRIGLVALTIATAVGYSRVYVGAHYPFDVLVGAALGILWGSAVAWTYRRWQNRGQA
ncbi:MAG: phosphatase PAP2 family protein [Deltaproteobacteria bacterium]|nr:phosphatase PAP2 family protein [Deltaproteobacteria bacterium]